MFLIPIIILIAINIYLLLNSGLNVFWEYSFKEGWYNLMGVMFAYYTWSTLTNIFCLLVLAIQIIILIKKLVLSRQYSAVRELYISLYNIRNTDELFTLKTYKKLLLIFEKNPKRKYNSLFGSLKELMIIMETRDEIDFLKKVGIISFKMEYTDFNKNCNFKNIKNNIFELIQFVENKMDYPDLSSIDKQLVDEIELSFDMATPELGKSSLKKLSTSIQEKEQKIYKLTFENVRNQILVFIGIGLTIFFGFLSFF
jgi:hypothetical protein